MIGSFNLLTKKVAFFNLGHNPPIFIAEQGETKLFPATSVPLGIAQELDTNMKREEEDLSKGRMFFYTDGFPETKKNGKEIGEEGLLMI